MSALSVLAPVLVASLALGAAASWPLGALIAALSAALALVGERWEVDRGRQLVSSVMGAVVGYSAVSLFYDRHDALLGEGWAQIASATLLAAAARFVLVRPLGGRAGTVVMVYVALLAIGETRGERLYPAFVALFLAASVWSLAAADRGRSRTLGSARRALASLAVVALAGALGAGATVGLRQAHAAAMRRARSATLPWRAQTGFSDRMELGSLSGLLDSDTVVLRVRGAEVDYLRGSAFDVYEAGRWLRSDTAEAETLSTMNEPLGEGGASGGSTSGGSTRVVQITAVSERTDRFFLPLGTEAASLVPGEVKVDRLGSIKRAGKEGLVTARARLGPRAIALPKGPGYFDLTLSRPARALLTPLACDWIGDATSTEDRLDAIEKRLAREFTYARSSNHGQSLDPALDFLLNDRRGHCEYFASGMALVARAAGIPARVVAGYRVAEQSPFADYRVVREKNAHAWVEVWVDGKGWVTRDPTPPELVPQNLPHRAGYLAALVDAARVGYDDATDWLAHRSLAQISLASLAGVVALGIIVARGARGRSRSSSAARPDELAPEPLSALLEALAAQGFSRPDHEPLEHLADRLPDPHLASLLRRLAALRYGDVGDRESLFREAREAASRARR